VDLGVRDLVEGASLGFEEDLGADLGEDLGEGLRAPEFEEATEETVSGRTRTAIGPKGTIKMTPVLYRGRFYLYWNDTLRGSLSMRFFPYAILRTVLVVRVGQTEGVSISKIS